MKKDQSIRLILFSVTITVFLAACGFIGLFDAGDSHQDDLAGVTWKLDMMGPRSNPYPAIPGHRPTLRFDFEDGRVSGRGGCNSYSAEMKVKGDRLTVGDAASTLVGCFPQEITNQESEFLRLLMQAKNFILEEGQLTIDCSGNQVLVFYQE